MQMIPSDLTHHTLDETIYVPTTNGKSFSNTEANAKTKQNSLTASSSLMALYSLSSVLATSLFQSRFSEKHQGSSAT